MMQTIELNLKKEYVIEKILYENKLAKTKVFIARDIALNRTIVLKGIEYHDRNEKQAILREISNQILLETYSDYVPRIYNIHIDEKSAVVWLEMQQIVGKSLRDIMNENVIKEKNRQWYEDTYQLLCSICQSVSYIHKAKQFVHKDLKPENIIVNRNRKSTYIIDFGISGPWMSKGIGTEKYMAPEQRNQVDKFHVIQATDVFALGQIAIEMFTGETLVNGKDLIYNPTGNTWIKAKDVTEIGRPYYPELGAIITKALSMNPADRFPTAYQMLCELRNKKTNVNSHLQPAGVVVQHKRGKERGR